jgi:hypothetical protein
VKEGSCYLNSIRIATDVAVISERTLNNRSSIYIWKGI